jgi:hypothetical protein
LRWPAASATSPKRNPFTFSAKARPGDSRIPFNYKDVSQGKNMAQNIKLQPGDTIIVP